MLISSVSSFEWASAKGAWKCPPSSTLLLVECLWSCFGVYFLHVISQAVSSLA